MNSVRDYSVDALITSDIPMVKILPSRAVIYFKQKDKFKIDGKWHTWIDYTKFNNLIDNLQNVD